MTFRQLFALFVLCSMFSSVSSGQEAGGGAAAAETYEVKAEAIRIKTTVPGTFESLKAQEIEIATKQLAGLTVERALPRGAVVRKGQPIIWFETEKVDRQIKEAEYNLRLAELTLRDAELAMQQLIAAQSLDKESADRSRLSAEQKYDNYVKTDHHRNQVSADFSLKSSLASLENEVEELKQLEKMYKEDELTEESEEIVLKRARQAVESAQFRHEGAEIANDRTIKQALPLEMEQAKEELARQVLAYDKTIKSLAAAQQRKTIELDQQKFGFEKQQRDLAQLREDRRQFVITSPIDGVVYYGPIVRGQLGDGKQGPKLDKGSAVTNGQTLMTIVDANALQIRIDLNEAHLHNLDTADAGVAIPTAYPHRPLNVKVKSVSFVPHAANQFDCVATVQLDKQTPPIMPGMTCSVEFVVYKKDDALTVPETAVFSDDQKTHYVYVVPPGQAAKQQAVVIGNKSDGKTEIVSGLKAGDVILLKKPA